MSNVITNSSTIQLKDRGGPPYGSLPAGEVSSVIRNGVTWTFDEEVTAGTFASGDPWVVGPVTITAITPEDATIGRNGTMVNPAISLTHGHDDRLLYGTYDSSLDITQSLPKVVAVGSSVVSCVSVGDPPASQPHNSAPPKLSFTDQVEILTVLTSAPASGSFRPPYTGTDKSIVANISDIDYSKLGSLAQPNGGANVPDLADVEAYFEHPWYEQFDEWQGTFYHPVLNFPRGHYGREIGRVTAEALLSLQLDYSNAQKETLLIRVIQAGIDIYGIVRAGHLFPHNGANHLGRKGLMVCAAVVLDHTDMKVWSDGTLHHVFQEDQQTFIISQEEVNITNDVGLDLTAATFTTSTKNLNQTGKFSAYSWTTGDKVYITGGTGVTPALYEIASRTDDDNIVLVADIGGTNPSDVTSAIGWSPDLRESPGTPFSAGDIGTPEWGIKHHLKPFVDNFHWDAIYRDTNCHMMGTATAIEIMGSTAVWNYDPFFQYQERFYTITEGDANGSNLFMLVFTKDMHAAYGGFP